MTIIVEMPQEAKSADRTRRRTATRRQWELAKVLQMAAGFPEDKKDIAPLYLEQACALVDSDKDGTLGAKAVSILVYQN